MVRVKNPDDIAKPDAFSGEDGYAALFKLSNKNKKFKAAVWYFKAADVSLDTFEKALSSLVLEN
jgi:hypothetical protein